MRSPEDLQDMGTYLQNLLQIMAVDGHLHEREIKRIHEYGAEQGFEASYIAEMIDSVLTNRYFPKKPGRFHSKETAHAFILDAVGLAACDGVLHAREAAWILEAARVNGIDPALIEEHIRKTISH